VSMFLSILILFFFPTTTPELIKGVALSSIWTYGFLIFCCEFCSSYLNRVFGRGRAFYNNRAAGCAILFFLLSYINSFVGGSGK